MKKASQILLLVGGILGIIAAVGCLIGAIVCLVFGSSAGTEIIREGVEKAASQSTQPVNVEAATAAIQATLIFSGSMCAVLVVLEVLGSIFAFKTRANNDISTTLAVLTIVFTAIGGNYPALAGAILALIDSTRHPKQLPPNAIEE